VLDFAMHFDAFWGARIGLFLTYVGALQLLLVVWFVLSSKAKDPKKATVQRLVAVAQVEAARPGNFALRLVA